MSQLTWSAFPFILSFLYYYEKVIEVDPSIKKVVSEIHFENADMITSCAFGGPNLDELYVTSARIGDNIQPEVRNKEIHILWTMFSNLSSLLDGNYSPLSRTEDLFALTGCDRKDLGNPVYLPFQAGSIFRVTGLAAGVKGITMDKFPRVTLEKLMTN